jgi:hypothetical protein
MPQFFLMGTLEAVERALTTMITQEHSSHAQLWTSLTTPQKRY